MSKNRTATADTPDTCGVILDCHCPKCGECECPITRGSAHRNSECTYTRHRVRPLYPFSR